MTDSPPSMKVTKFPNTDRLCETIVDHAGGEITKVFNSTRVSPIEPHETPVLSTCSAVWLEYLSYGIITTLHLEMSADDVDSHVSQWVDDFCEGFKINLLDTLNGMVNEITAVREAGDDAEQTDFMHQVQAAIAKKSDGSD